MTEAEGWGDRVRRYRRIRGWTQHELADRAGIDRRYVGRIEASEVGNPEPETVKRLASALNVSVRAVAEPLGWYDGEDTVPPREQIEQAILSSDLSEEKKQAAMTVMREFFNNR